MVKVAQLGFTGGEFSYPMYGRPDDSQYAYALGRARNFLIRPQGTLRSRPGFEFITEAKYPSRKVRLIPFQFSATDTAIIEMGHHYMRFIVDGGVVLDGSDVYEISTPYNEADLFSIHYDQSADVMTLVHTSYSPMTLKRYGATDWRLEDLDLSMKMTPPENVSAAAYYPTQEEEEESGSFGYEESDKDKVESSYCVTAIDEDDNESERSEVATTMGNFYITGAYNEVTWDAVDGAVRYSVYREEGGIYAFIGETEELYLRDYNISADTTKTPPSYVEFFASAGGIRLVEVVDGGSGYIANSTYYQLPSTVRIPVFYGWEATYEGEVTLPSTLTVQATFSESDGTYAVSGDVNLTLREYDTGKYHYAPSDVVVSSQEDFKGSYINVSISASHPYTDPIVKLSAPVLSGVTFTYGKMDGDFEATAENVAQIAGGNSTAAAMVSDDGATLSSVMTYTGQTIQAQSTGNVVLTVTDSTGSGASLKAVVSNGSITGVIVNASGQDYTDPTVTASGGGGSGATFSVTLFTDDDIQAPGALGLFEQRRWFAGTSDRPLAIWATRSGTTDEMSRHYPTQYSDDCIVVQAETRDANRLRHIVPLQDLLMFTATAEWRVSASDGGAITPTNISVKPQSYYGATEVQPVIASNQCLYCTSRGGHIREMGYSRDVYGYLSSDISVRATHLFDSHKIEDMCYLKAPFPRLVCASSSGLICNCTYMPEQSLNAWSSFSTDGEFESCAAIPEGGDEGEDALYVVVRRVIEGEETRYIERMGTIEDNTTMALGLDSCLTGSFDTPQTVVGGLSHLEGKTVGAQCDGKSVHNLVVTNGQVTLPVAASNIVVGLPIDYSILTLPFITQMSGYAKGRVKNVGKVYLQVIYDGELSAGPTEDQLVPLKTEFYNRYTDEPSEPTLKEVSAVMRGKWSDLGQMLIEKTNFLPIEITSWAADVEVS